jgi:hypothetical protein
VGDAEPYRRTPLWRLSHLLTSVSLLLSLPRRRDRRREVIAGLTGLAGSTMVKFAVAQAGDDSTTKSPS